MPLWSPDSLSNERRYFFQLFVSVLVSVGNGSIFCFGIFSPFMKSPAFSMTQTQINIVSTCGVVLSYASLPTGYLFDRYGPKWTLMCGAILNVIGWLGMFVIFYDMDAPLLGTSTGVISFFFALSQWSASFYETGSVLTNLEAMSLHQGRVVTIQKTFMGLGSSIITQVYIAFFEGRYSIATFFLFLAIFNASLGVLGAYTIRLPSPETRVIGLNCEFGDSDKKLRPSSNGHVYGALPQDPVVVDDVRPSATVLARAISRFDRPFQYGIGLLLAVVAFVVGLTIAEAYWSVEGNWRYLVGGVTLLLLLLFAVMVVLVPKSHDSKDINGDSDTSTTHPPSDGRLSLIEMGQEQISPELLNGRPLAHNLRLLDLRLMWVVSFAVWGTGTVVSANSSQIYQSLDYSGYTTSLDSVYVSIYGVASAVGRIVVGTADGYLRSRGLHVVRLFPIAPIINVLGIPLFFVLPARGLIVAFFLSGLATGVTWGSTVLIIKSLFTANNCGKHYNVLYTAGMLTPLLMNIALFGPLYDRESERQGLTATHTCSGSSCIEVPLLVSLALNVIAVPCAVLLMRRIIANRGIS